MEEKMLTFEEKLDRLLEMAKRRRMSWKSRRSSMYLPKKS